MNSRAMSTESEAIKHNITETLAVGFHLSPWHEDSVLVQSHLDFMWGCLLGLCVPGLLLYTSACAFPTPDEPCFLSPMCLSRIPNLKFPWLKKLRNATESGCWITHGGYMNKSVLSITNAVENIGLCTHTLWQIIEVSPWAEYAKDIIIKSRVLLPAAQSKRGSYSFYQSKAS